MRQRARGQAGVALRTAQPVPQVRPGQLQPIRSGDLPGVGPGLLRTRPPVRLRRRRAHEDELHHEAPLRAEVDPRGMAQVEVGQAHRSRAAAHRQRPRPFGVVQPAVEVGAGNHVGRPQLLRRVLRVVHQPQVADVVVARAAQRGVGVLVAVAGQLGRVVEPFRGLLSLDVAEAVRVLEVAGAEQAEQGAVHLRRFQHVAHLRYQRQDVVAGIVGPRNRRGQPAADGLMQVGRQ